jgi:hypothetical protein
MAGLIPETRGVNRVALSDEYTPAVTRSSDDVPSDWSRSYYQRSLLRWLLTASALLGVLNAALNPMTVVLLPGWAVIIVMVWFVPVGVVTARSIKPSPFRRRIAWARIAQVTERRRGGSTSIRLALNDGKTVACRIPLSEIGMLQQLAAPGTAAGPPLAGPQTRPPVTSNTWSTLAFICAGIAVLFVPIVFGLGGFVCARVASSRGESRARMALAFAVTGTIFGFMLGAVGVHLR